MRVFFFHYNKPASQAAKEPRLTVHFRGQCLSVGAIKCLVPIESKNRKTQPRCVMAGRANDVRVINNVATIS